MGIDERGASHGDRWGYPLPLCAAPRRVHAGIYEGMGVQAMAKLSRSIGYLQESRDDMNGVTFG